MTADEAASNFHVSCATALRAMAKTQMREFTAADWDSYAGCDTRNPMIGEFGEYTLVLDGNTLNICHVDDSYGGQFLQLNELC